MIYDSIHTIEIDGDEDGWSLILHGLDEDYHLNIHGVAAELLTQFQEKILPWWAEGEAAKDSQPFNIEDDEDGYNRRDPKHPHHLRIVVND